MCERGKLCVIDDLLTDTNDVQMRRVSFALR